MSTLDGYSQFLYDLTPIKNQPISINNTSTGKVTNIPAVSFPLAYCIVVTTDGIQYNIPNILEFHCKNTLNAEELPGNQVTFVIGEDEEPPDIGPMDEIYLFAQYFDANIYNSAGLILNNILASIAFQDISNRVATGVVTRCHKIRDNNQGKVYQIKFNTFMKKLYITSEFKQTNPEASDFFIGASAISQLFMNDIGQIVKIAFDQSNMPWSYIYMATGASLHAATPSLSEDIITDPYGQQTQNNNFPLKVTIPFIQSIVDWEYRKWIQILNSLNQMSFTELFCNKYGQAYYRQAGMFRTAGSWDVIVDPSIVEAYDVSEGDESICTRLEVRWFPPGVSVQVPYVFVPPDWQRLEEHYSGPRYDMVQTPWLTFVESKLYQKDPTLVNVTDDLIKKYQADYATWELAQRNGAAVQGICSLIGNTSFDVGMTVYFKPEDLVFYVVETEDDFAVGKKWTTKLTLNYGRSRNVDFLGYLSKGVSVFGQVENTTDANGASTNPVAQNPPVSTSPTNPIDLQTPNQGDKYDPFGIYKYICTNPWGLLANPAWGNDSSKGTHSGIDLVPADSDCNGLGPQEIYSICDGTVTGLGTSVEASYGWGYYICIRSKANPNLVFCYAHLAQVPGYKIGDTVILGEALALEGATGRVSAAHLHFQVDDFAFNGGTMPTNIWASTVNPWKFISLDAACSSKGFPPDTFTTPVHNAGDWIPGTFDGQTVYADPNFQEDVQSWSRQLLQGSGALAPYSFDVQSFFIALAMVEVGDINSLTFGGHFLGIYNFGGVDHNGVYDSYKSMAESVTAYKNYFNSENPDRYINFLGYIQGWQTQTIDFNFNKAIAFLIGSGYTGNTGDTEYIQKFLTAYQKVEGRMQQ